MSFFLANPWGLLALSVIPVIVAIHFLQEQSRRVRTSTLFLLEHAQPTSEGGFRLERFRNSLPFWMQILAACALAWLLADPRWVQSQARQTVAVVLDSTASMQAFRRETLDGLAARLRSWEAAADRTDWHLLETGPRRPPLYAGRSLTELLAAAEARWQPMLGSHAFDDALVAARALVPGDAGGVILVTDRPADVPADVAVLSVGEPFDNVGFSGGSVDVAAGKAAWRVLVTHHGDTPRTQELVVRAAGASGLVDGAPLSPASPLDLGPKQRRPLMAEWPADGRDRLVLTLRPDRFAFDDALPLMKPVPRRVRLHNRLSGPAGELLAKMASVVDGVDLVAAGDEPDLVIDAVGAEPTVSSVLVAGDDAMSEETKQVFDPAWVAAEDHPLVRDLGWGGLLSGPAGGVTVTANDTPLLWKGGKPLAFLRTTGGARERRTESLVLNWNLTNSTAARTSAVVVMLSRFVERVRERIPRGWTENVETGQAIPLPDGRQARAPETPGFFSVPLAAAAGDARQVMIGAAQFADTRECDFRRAAPIDTLDSLRMERIVKRSVEDPWAPLWVTVAAAALLVAWGWRSRT
ncbi:MAG: BatA domain-containing protein [Pirellulales bacterium]